MSIIPDDVREAWDRTPAAPEDGDDGTEPPASPSLMLAPRGTSGKGAPRKRGTHGKRRSSLRFEILNAFVDTGMASLTRSEITVWMTVYRDTKPDGTARASFDDIARRAGIDRRSVTRAIGSLKRRKMLQIVWHGGLNQGPSTYRVFPFRME